MVGLDAVAIEAAEGVSELLPGAAFASEGGYLIEVSQCPSPKQG